MHAAKAPGTHPSATPRPAVAGLRKRAEFLALNRARRQAAATMLVQGRDRGDGCCTIRVGFTCSRKVGNAVQRNRAKRRLRAVARELLPEHGRPGWDYALIGRAGATAGRPFQELQRDLRFALRKLHAAR
jgi:ribonuclease P protein component